MWSLPVKHSKQKMKKKEISLRAINDYAFARKNPIRGKASGARVTEIIILLKCLSHGKKARF